MVDLWCSEEKVNISKANVAYWLLTFSFYNRYASDSLSPHKLERLKNWFILINLKTEMVLAKKKMSVKGYK